MSNKLIYQEKDHQTSTSAKKQLLEWAIIILAGSILIFGMLYKTGTLKSGYHLMDDHELIRMEYSIKVNGESVWKVMTGTIKNDFWWRFRPFYWVERVGLTALWGSNLYYWNIYKGIQGIFTFVFLYFAARKMNHKWHLSFLFASIIMLGAQFTPWFRSANQENTGLFLCSVILFLIALGHNTQKYRSRWIYILLVFFIILCGLEKESFTLMIPAFAALKFWLEYCHLKETSPKEKPFKKAIKNNLLFLITTGIAFLINVFFIAFKVGVDHVSYAGFHKETNLSEYFYGIRDSLFFYLKWYYIIGIILILLVVVCYQLINIKHIRYYMGFLLIGCYICGVQLLAHAKSLMWQRYIIPFIIGYAFIFILLGYQIFSKDKFRRRVYEGILIVLLLLEAPEAYKLSRNYAYDGQMIQNQFQTILENTDEDSLIIGAYKDGELNLATSCWLEVNGRVHVYSYDWTELTLTDSVQMVQSTVGDENVSWESCAAAMCYYADTASTMELMGLSGNPDTKIYQYGNYTIIVR